MANLNLTDPALKAFKDAYTKKRLHLQTLMTEACVKVLREEWSGIYNELTALHTPEYLVANFPHEEISAEELPAVVEQSLLDLLDEASSLILHQRAEWRTFMLKGTECTHGHITAGAALPAKNSGSQLNNP